MKNWFTDEVLYYFGITAAIAAVLLFFVYLAISRVQMSKLRRQLEEEYGKNHR